MKEVTLLQKNVLTLNKKKHFSQLSDLKHFSLKINKYICRILKFHHKQLIKRKAMMKKLK